MFGETFLGTTVSGLVGLSTSGQLPNITAALNSVVMYDGFSGTGSFAVGSSLGTVPGPNSGGPQRRPISFDASRSSSIYGESHRVIPAGIYTAVLIKY